MSTKTSIKRIAAVAAVALTLGGFSAVSAHATASTGGATISVSGPTAGLVGAAQTFKVSYASSGTTAASDTVTVTPVLTFTPAVTGGTTTTTVAGLGTGTAGTLTNATQSTASGVTTYTVTAAGAASGSISFTFTPNTAGTYSFTVTPTGSGTGVYLPTTYTETIGNRGIITASGTGMTSATTGYAATASDIADGSHYATVKITGGHLDSGYSISSTGVGSIVGLATASPNYLVYSNGASVSAGFIWTDVADIAAGTLFTGTGSDTVSFAATSATAGTQVITATPLNGTSAPITETITWGAAPVVSAQYSTAYLGSASAVATADATVVASKSASGATAVANVAVTLNSAASTPILGQSLAVSISGPGTLSLGTTLGTTGTATGRSLSYTGDGVSTSSTFSVGIFADGTAGVSTITITSGTTAIATKTVTFTGAPAKATATQNLYIAKAGSVLGVPFAYFNGTALTGATVSGVAATSYATGTAPIVASVVDANGNPVAGATVKLVSSNSAVIVAGNCVEEVSSPAASTDTPGTFQCSVSGASAALAGQTATVTFEVYNAATAAYDILATPLTFAIGKAAPTTMTLTTDASSYAALAPMIITVTAKDSAGNLIADQDAAPLASLISSVQLGGSLASPAAVVNGVAKIKTAYAPAVAGSFTISGLDNLSAAGEAVSVTAASAGGSSDAAAQAAVDAANEATDAANAATDAANNAMDSADAAQQAALDAGDKADAALAAVTDLATKVSAIASQIASLSALVKKIAAKVKA